MNCEGKGGGKSYLITRQKLTSLYRPYFSIE